MYNIRIFTLFILSLYYILFNISNATANTKFELNLTDINVKQAYVIDLDTHAVLYEKNSEMLMTPSSMSKLMTLYVVFSKLNAGSVSLDTQCSTSREASMIGGSTMFLRENQKVSIKELIDGTIIVSGNDAAQTLAECTSGSLSIFVSEMNEVAKIIGLHNSHFTNSTGWPDKGHYMTAKDIAILSEALYTDFPEYYPLFAQESFTFNNITQRSTNDLLFKDIGVTGIKTGRTEDGGFGVSVLSHDKNNTDNRKVLVVVNGLSSNKERVDVVEKFIRYAYNTFSNVSIFNTGDHVLNLYILNGTRKYIPIVASENIIYTYKKFFKNNIKAYLKYNDNIQAPIEKGDVIGSIEIHNTGNNGNEVSTFLLRSGHDVPKVSNFKAFFKKLLDFVF